MLSIVHQVTNPQVVLYGQPYESMLVRSPLLTQTRWSASTRVGRVADSAGRLEDARARSFARMKSPGLFATASRPVRWAVRAPCAHHVVCRALAPEVEYAAVNHQQKDFTVDLEALEIDKETAKDLYRDMRLGRDFEDMCAQMYYRGKMFGFVHLYCGQEAVSTGVIRLLGKKDYVCRYGFLQCPGVVAVVSLLVGAHCPLRPLVVARHVSPCQSLTMAYYCACCFMGWTWDDTALNAHEH
jgi:hypothetical protein